ncbi:MAG: hypothetical protein ABJO86_14110 [Lentilitoribacter sp.]
MIINPAPTNSSGAFISTSAISDIGTSVAEHIAVPGAVPSAVPEAMLGAQAFAADLGNRFQDRCENEHGLDALFVPDQSQDTTTHLLGVDGGLR